MNGAKVQSIDSLLVLRAWLLKFAERAESIIGECECELQGVMTWLETEADTYWRLQIRKRQEDVVKAKAALRAKKLFKSDLSQRSTVDEEKALRLAQTRLEESERTLEAVRRYRLIMQKEMDEYKGQVQRFAGAVTIDLPIAAAKLEALVQHLNQYVAVKPTESPGAPGPETAWQPDGTVGDPPSMARPEPGDEQKQQGEGGGVEGKAGNRGADSSSPSAIGGPKGEDTRGSL